MNEFLDNGIIDNVRNLHFIFYFIDLVEAMTLNDQSKACESQVKTPT